MQRPEIAKRIVRFALLTVLAASLSFSPFPATAQTRTQTMVLASVAVQGPLQDLGLPVYGLLQTGSGNDRALVITSRDQIATSGLAYRVLDDPASPGSYFLARERRKGAREAAAGRFTLLDDDGKHLLLKGGPEIAGELARLGFGVKALPVKAMIFRIPPGVRTAPRAPLDSGALALTYDARVASMMSQVQQSALWTEVGNLSGENEITVGGSPYRITTRQTWTGTPIEMATQYVYERMASMGLAVYDHTWSQYNGYFVGRNVIATKAGKSKPSEIVLITAHLDSTSDIDGLAPGADDNASGSAALLTIAEIMAPGTFERTLRFVFFTGEELGLFGSAAYADAIFSNHENVVAVYNMDMIAWDGSGGPTLRLHTRRSSDPGYMADMAIATTFTDVVSLYGLSSALSPAIASDRMDFSDHGSFWDKGYGAIQAIEDDVDDFNPYYHSIDDTRDRLNMAYFTAFTMASVGTAAHLAGPAEPSGDVTLAVMLNGRGQGRVTSEPSGMDCGAICEALFPLGRTVTLTAAPAAPSDIDAGSVFSGWSGGGCSGTTPCTVNTDANRGVMARFDRNGADVTGRLYFNLAGNSAVLVRNATATLQGTGYRATTSDGSFTFQNVASGDYVLVVSSPDMNTMIQNITVTGGQPLEVDLPYMTPAAAACGIAGDASGNGRLGLEDAIYILQVLGGWR